jgi:integrase
VRDWHAAIAADHPTTAAKSYRLLSSIMRTAVADDLITRSPCAVKGAAVERPAERPVASVAEVEALAAAMPAHLRVAVLLAAWCQLRRGEVLGLRRRDVNVLKGTISIEVTRTITMAGNQVVKDPKTEAGRRTVAVPPNVLPALSDHLSSRYVGADPDALVVVGMKGDGVTAGVLGSAWDKARKAVGRPDLRFHDLRHSGLTWSAATGATVAELMRRAGHASPRAALRYQHATEDRDRALADALAGLAKPANITSITASDESSREDAADISRTSAAVGE